MTFLDFIWIFFILSWLFPAFRQRRIQMTRLRLMERLEATRGSRVITLIHRQESFTLLGMLSRRYINIEDSEQVLRAIRFTPPDRPIDLILHTPGGLVLASEQIAEALTRHPARVTVFVPHYAMSGGTMIALSADEIRMDENAVLGPVDPQIGSYPAASILRVLDLKEKKDIDDETLILADVARKAMFQVETTVRGILEKRLPAEQAADVARVLTEGRWTHDFPIDCEMLKGMGLPVACGLPREVYTLMDLYPQPAQRRPSVQYIPIPYRSRNNGQPDEPRR